MSYISKKGIFNLLCAGFFFYFSQNRYFSSKKYEDSFFEQIHIDESKILEIADEEAKYFCFEFDKREASKIKVDEGFSYIKRKLGLAEFNKLDDFLKIGPFVWEVNYFHLGELVAVLSFSFNGELLSYVKKNVKPGNSKIYPLTRSEAFDLALKKLQKFSIKDVSFKEKNFKESRYNFAESDLFSAHQFYLEGFNEIGEIRQSYTITIFGSEVVELLRSIKFPDEFYKELEALRKSDNTLERCSRIIESGVIVMLLFIFWKYILYNEKDLVLFSFKLATILELSKILANLSDFRNFIIQDILSVVIFTTPLFIVCGLYLCKKAFPEHINFSYIFTYKYLTSKKFLDTFLRSLFLACGSVFLQETFYLITFKYFGFYSYYSGYLPAESGVGVFFKILQRSVFAGVKEEIIYRGIFVSLAFITYRRYKSKIMLVFFFLFQAIIFAIAHKGLLIVPFYSRIIEIIPFSILYGVALYSDGIVMIILAHFLTNFFILTLTR